MNTVFVMVFVIIMFYILGISSIDAHCVDIHSHLVSQGIHYVPGPNPCTLCICDKGSPKWCKSVLCSPPSNCKSFEVGNSCCEFKCLDDILNSPDYSETYDLSLRLIASAVTAVLSLSILFFLIHRLRQRKIRMQENRQMSEDQRCLNSIGYIAGSMGYLPGSIGYLDSTNNDLEFHYDDSNVHYPLWKPSGNYFPHGEAPPPYEEAVRAAHAEADAAANSHISTNITSLPFITSRNENVNLTLVHNTHVSITSNMQQSSVSTSQSNVLRQFNEQSVQADTRTESNEIQNQVIGNTNAAITSGPSSSYEQVDVHHDSHNRTVTSVTPSSSKTEELVVKQTNVDRPAYNNSDDKPIANNTKQCDTLNVYGTKDQVPLSCSSSWRREVSRSNDRTETPREYNQKLPHKNHVLKSESTTSNAVSILKNGSDYSVKTKFKNCDYNVKDTLKKNVNGKYTDKQSVRIIAKTDDIPKTVVSHSTHGETLSHRTISQKLSKTLKNLESDSYYMNFMDYGKNKQTDDDFYDGHRKVRTNGKFDRKILEKPNESLKECTCLYLDVPTMQKGIGMLKGDVSVHRTLSKSLRDIDGNLHFTFDNPNKDTDCIMPRALIKNSESRTEMMKSLRAEQAKHEYHEALYSNTGTLGRKYLHEEKHSSNSSGNSSSGSSVTFSTQNEVSRPTVKTIPEKEAVDVISEQDENCISDHNQSSALDDVDDYRSECENCKCLNYDSCKDDSLLNETMTLQRRPTEQGEDHSYHKTFLTLPSHIKRSKSVTLNTPRESWFMAMQEMTSSSESD